MIKNENCLVYLVLCDWLQQVVHTWSLAPSSVSPPVIGWQLIFLSCDWSRLTSLDSKCLVFHLSCSLLYSSLLSASSFSLASCFCSAFHLSSCWGENNILKWLIMIITHLHSWERWDGRISCTCNIQSLCCALYHEASWVTSIKLCKYIV